MADSTEQTPRTYVVRSGSIAVQKRIKEILDKAPLEEILKSHNVNATAADLYSSLKSSLVYYITDGPYGSHQEIKAKALPRKRRLQKMAKLAKTLNTEYEYFFDDLEGFVRMCSSRKGISVAHSDEKHPLMKEAEESQNTPVILSQLLEVLPDAIAHELAWKHPDIPGRPKEKGLQSLIHSLAFFWEKHQDCEFTVDHHAGAAISDALAFVRDSILAVEDIPETAIVTAARTVRSKMIAHKNLDENEVPF